LTPDHTVSAIAIIDFETTGISPNMGDRATEVAVVMLENGQVVDRYQSLMNAGVRVNSFITQLTGITNEMVQAAPTGPWPMPRWPRICWRRCSTT